MKLLRHVPRYSDRVRRQVLSLRDIGYTYRYIARLTGMSAATACAICKACRNNAVVAK